MKLVKRLVLGFGAVLALVIILAVIFGSTKGQPGPGAGTSTTSTSNTTIATVSASSSHARPRPCVRWTLNAHTSCPFAQAVVKAYDAHPSASIVAYSPVTHQSYTLQCQQVGGVAVCAVGTASVAFPGPPIPGAQAPTVPAATTPPSTSTAQAASVEQPGSTDHSTDAQFCTTHNCIPNFPNGNGYIVQCVDQTWSHSGGLSGACSDHGGES